MGGKWGEENLSEISWIKKTLYFGKTFTKLDWGLPSQNFLMKNYTIHKSSICFDCVTNNYEVDEYLVW